MATPSSSMSWVRSLPRWLSSTVAVAVGAEERSDPTLARTGGPAGNARLTAWTGLLLLVLFAAEGLTLLDIHGLITWHIAIGALVVPPVALKVATTGWRMIGYYRGAPHYRSAGPPPLLLRLLGPWVVLSSVALLATGVVLVLLGQERSGSSVGNVAGIKFDWIWLHQASFVVWFAAMTLHVLGRSLTTVRAVRAAARAPREVPGLASRVVALAAAGALGVVCAVALVRVDGSWS